MKSINTSVVLSLICNLFHYYAFSIYAFSAVILAPIFFHTEDIYLTKILGLITLGVTLIIKPLGSVILGHIGDKYGRKKALVYSLVAITISTTSIGLIPSYETIGWLSGALLLSCLLVQGMCTGGQFAGAIIFIQEHTQKHFAAFSCGLVGAIGVFGTLLGTATSFLFYHTKGIGWEWRIPFLLTSIFGFFLLYLMQHMQETPVFIENKDLFQKQKVPLFNIIKNHKQALYSAICISSIPVSLFYLATVYLPNFYGDLEKIEGSFNSLIYVCLAQILCIFLIPLFGYMADKVGKEKQLKSASILLILSPFFIFYPVGHFINIYVLIFAIVLLSVYLSLYAGPAPAYLSERFPVVGRYSGMGVGIAIGEGLFGGLSPIICVGIEHKLDSKLAPAYFILFLGIISLSGILFSDSKIFPSRQADSNKRRIKIDEIGPEKYINN